MCVRGPDTRLARGDYGTHDSSDPVASVQLARVPAGRPEQIVYLTIIPGFAGESYMMPMGVI